jgi:hypothetical protein
VKPTTATLCWVIYLTKLIMSQKLIGPQYMVVRGQILIWVRRDIARRNKEAWESFPEAVRYYPAIWNSNRSREECFFTVLIYLDLIYNDFLLQRTLVRRIRARYDELLRISRLLMTTLLDVIGNRASLRSSYCDIPWLVRSDSCAQRLSRPSKLT